MASSPDASPAGQGMPRHGRWRVGPLLGQGGLGRVFLAHDGAGRAAALRVVRGSLARDREFRRRFGCEVQAIAAVRGPRVAALVDADPYAEAPWLAMEYVAGPTLAARVRGLVGPLGGTLPVPELRRLANALAGALDDIHRAGLVHGGLRPSNVLLAADGPRVVDFGMAGCAARAGYGGRPGYTAPELRAHGVLKPPADVFSLGAVLAFAAAGRGPFDAGGDGRELAGVPDLAGVPEELLPLVTACLAGHPTARPAPRTVARMAGLPLPGSRRRSLTLAGTLLLAQLAAVTSPLGGRWMPRTVER